MRRRFWRFLERAFLVMADRCHDASIECWKRGWLNPVMNVARK